jgi:hypothetical protein
MEILEMALHQPIPSAKAMAGIVEEDSKTPMAGGDVKPDTTDEPDMKGKSVVKDG